jgi:hypothetical protein
VLQIWDSIYDLNYDSKDIPCNDLIMLKIRDGRLNMTVCNRSNDIIWGAYGANAVQFSIIQEYIAAKLGVLMGTYTQVSDSYHAYPDNPQYAKLVEYYKHNLAIDLYSKYEHDLCWPLVNNPDTFDQELALWMHHPNDTQLAATMENTFFSEVATPMAVAWELHKKQRVGLQYVALIKAMDWREACRGWLERREL